MALPRLHHQDHPRDCSGAAGALWCRPVAAPVLLRTENLRRSFGRLAAVDGVDFEVSAGELRAVIGPKMGILPARRGRVLFDGRDVTPCPPTRSHAVASRSSPRIAGSSRASRWPRTSAWRRGPGADTRALTSSSWASPTSRGCASDCARAARASRAAPNALYDPRSAIASTANTSTSSSPPRRWASTHGANEHPTSWP